MSRVSGLAELVRLRVLQGTITPHDLRMEAMLVRELKTTRTSLREALRLLEGRGLLRSDAGGGMHLAGVDAQDVRELLWLRLVLEPPLAARAAERRRAGALRSGELRELHRTAAAPDPATAADRTFALLVAGLADLRPAQDALHRAWDHLLLAARQSEHAAARLEHSPAARRALAAAIDAGDADAAAEGWASALAVVLARWA